MIISTQVYLATGVTDMRKSINGLSVFVCDELELDPLSKVWFVFCNRGRDKIKYYFGTQMAFGFTIPENSGHKLGLF